jgi:myo-inositol-1(or 4)-monophosphatase
VSEPDVVTLRSVAVRVAGEAADLVARMRADGDDGVAEGVAEVDTKSSETDAVTAADRASERLIRALLARQRPGEPVLGEELGSDGAAGASDGVSWVVDPIDGTVNYLYGLPWYAVSVAAVHAGRPVAAGVVEPSSGRVWSAALGHGATLDGRRLRVSGERRLDLALVGTGFAYSRERRVWQARLVGELVARTRDVRRGGSAVLELCGVAAGWLDGFVEHGLSPWDWSGASLIATEAGAVLRVPTADGSDPDGMGADVTVAAAPGIARELHELIRGVVSGPPG